MPHTTSSKTSLFYKYDRYMDCYGLASFGHTNPEEKDPNYPGIMNHNNPNDPGKQADNARYDELINHFFYKPFNEENGGFFQHLYVMFVSSPYYSLYALGLISSENIFAGIIALPFIIIATLHNFIFQSCGLISRVIVTVNESNLAPSLPGPRNSA